MDLSQRYKQAAKEARWALGLAILYVIGWCGCGLNYPAFIYLFCLSSLGIGLSKLFF